jgi:hypothetical protein
VKTGQVSRRNQEVTNLQRTGRKISEISSEEPIARSTFGILLWWVDSKAEPVNFCLYPKNFQPISRDQISMVISASTG